MTASLVLINYLISAAIYIGCFFAGVYFQRWMRDRVARKERKNARVWVRYYP